MRYSSSLQQQQAKLEALRTEASRLLTLTPDDERKQQIERAFLDLDVVLAWLREKDVDARPLGLQAVDVIIEMIASSLANNRAAGAAARPGARRLG